MSGVPKGSVLGPIIYTANLFDVVQNKLVNYTNDSTLFATDDKRSSRQRVISP